MGNQPQQEETEYIIEQVKIEENSENGSKNLEFMTQFLISYTVIEDSNTEEEFGEDNKAVKYLKKNRVESVKPGTVHEEVLEVLCENAEKLKNGAEYLIKWSE
jgi:hypothetical protein